MNTADTFSPSQELIHELIEKSPYDDIGGRITDNNEAVSDYAAEKIAEIHTALQDPKSRISRMLIRKAMRREAQSRISRVY